MHRLFTAILLLFLSTNVASAGILVMKKSGQVFVGRIDSNEVSDDFIVIRWPHRGFKSPTGSIDKTSSMKFERFRVRWFSEKSDLLTEDYFKRFAKKKLDSRFQKALLDYQRRSDTGANKAPELDDALRIIGFGRRRDKISPKPHRTKHYQINPPEGWKKTDAKGLVSVVSPKAMAGYNARIQVYSVQKPAKSVSELLEWYRAEIARLSEGRLELEGAPIEKIRAGLGTDVTLVSITRRGKLAVKALRYLLFRRDRVYFVACYASTKEFKRREALFKKCVKTMAIFEDDTR